MLAGAGGSIIIKFPNSSYFWVCTSLSRMSLKSALMSYGGVTFVNGTVAMVVVYVRCDCGSNLTSVAKLFRSYPKSGLRVSTAARSNEGPILT